MGRSFRKANSMFRLALLAAVALAGSVAAGCTPAAAPSPAPAEPAAPGAETARPGIRLCADFGLFPDDNPMPPTFTLSGFTFNNAAAPSAWIVNQEGYEKGLRLQAAGAEVRPPVVVDRIEMSLGTFAGELEVKAEDASGAVVASLTVPRTGAFKDYVLSAPGIVAVTFKGGDDEAGVKSLCVRMAGAPAVQG